MLSVGPAVCSTACPLLLGVLPGWLSFLRAGRMPLRSLSLHHNACWARTCSAEHLQAA